MGKGITMMYSQKGGSRYCITVLVLISAAFLLGGLAGYWVEGKLSTGTYISSFLETVIDENVSVSIGQEIWNLFRWPAWILMLRFLPLVGLSIPMLLCLRGFLLSYNISAFMREGLRTTILLFAPTCILTLPVLFLLSTEVLLRKAGEDSEGKPGWILACLLALCLCMLLDMAVIPDLLG